MDVSYPANTGRNRECGFSVISSSGDNAHFVELAPIRILVLKVELLLRAR